MTPQAKTNVRKKAAQQVGAPSMHIYCQALASYYRRESGEQFKDVVTSLRHLRASTARP